MDARIEAVIATHRERWLSGITVNTEQAFVAFAQEVGKILAQIAAEFDPKRYTEDISEALLRAVDVQKS